MELDSLKSVWQQEQSAPVIARQNADAEILKMTGRKSQSPVARMLRNMGRELLAVLIIYNLTIAYYVFENGSRYWLIVLLLILLEVFFAVYYYRTSKLLKAIQCIQCEVSSSLRRQVRTLEKYIRFYFIAGTVATPVAYFLTGLIVLHSSSKGISLSRYSIGFYAVFIGIGLVITLLVYLLNKWYVHKLYGRHLEKLQRLLNEIEETEQ